MVMLASALRTEVRPSYAGAGPLTLLIKYGCTGLQIPKPVVVLIVTAVLVPGNTAMLVGEGNPGPERKKPNTSLNT